MTSFPTYQIIKIMKITKLNAAPIPFTKAYLPELAQIVSKASLAAGQKLLPVNAIWFIILWLFYLNIGIFIEKFNKPLKTCNEAT
jgi:hypothetical protein